MKNTLLKAIIVSTLTLSLFAAGFASVTAVDTGVSVCHDGPHDIMPGQ